ncbi:hypothetical protein T08_10411 [Trichinella sp. T8]|nr:hypothetical protein T08_10411 [Trichinella sp. T8]
MYSSYIIRGNDWDVRTKHRSHLIIFHSTLHTFSYSVRWYCSTQGLNSTSQAEDRQVRITTTCQKSHCAIEDDRPLKCFFSILRVRASFNLAIESRRKQFDK